MKASVLVPAFLGCLLLSEALPHSQSEAPDATLFPSTRSNSNIDTTRILFSTSQTNNSSSRTVTSSSRGTSSSNKKITTSSHHVIMSSTSRSSNYISSMPAHKTSSPSSSHISTTLSSRKSASSPAGNSSSNKQTSTSSHPTVTSSTSRLSTHFSATMSSRTAASGPGRSSSSTKQTSSSSHHAVASSSSRSSAHNSSTSTHVTSTSLHTSASPSSHSMPSSHTNRDPTSTSSKSIHRDDLTFLATSSFVHSGSLITSQGSPMSTAKKDSTQNGTIIYLASSSKYSRPARITPTSMSKAPNLFTNSQLASSTANVTAASSKQHPTGALPTEHPTWKTANTTLTMGLANISAPVDDMTTPPFEVPANSTSSNGTTKCTDGIFLDATCFNDLALSEYIQWWWARHEGICTSNNIQFAQCFYAIETKYAPSNCAQMNHDAACIQPVWQDFKNSRNGVHNFYVAWNIWNTNGFFLDMWTAIGAAEASTQAGLASIVALFDPPKQNTPFDVAINVLLLGFSLYSEGSIITKAFLRLVAQSNSLQDKLFPSGTVDGQYQDWSVIAGNVGKYTDSFRELIAQQLPLIQNNVTTFISWSQMAGLSGNRPPLHGLAENMTQAMNTYAIARIITTQRIVVSRAHDTDVHALQTNGSILNWDTGCGAGYDSLGVCDTYFWDGKDTYGLIDQNHYTRNFHGVLTALFSPNGGAPSLTTGKLLFTGAQKCFEATGKNGGSDPHFDYDRPEDNLCLSSAPVCTWDMNGFGPFDSSCKNLPDSDAELPQFGIEGCRGEVGEFNFIDVPRAYLGPGIYADGHGDADISAITFCNDVGE